MLRLAGRQAEPIFSNNRGGESALVQQSQATAVSQELETATGETGPSSTEVEGERDDEILASKYSTVNGFCPIVGANGGKAKDIDNHHHHHNHHHHKT